MYKTRRDMSMVFKFRMLSDENDHFVRDYEVPYDMTLLGFHEFITRSLGYEEGMSSFFTADKQWNRLREFTLMDMGDNSEDAPLPMADITLGQLIHNNRDRLIYQFDLMGDRAYSRSVRSRCQRIGRLYFRGDDGRLQLLRRRRQLQRR